MHPPTCQDVTDDACATKVAELTYYILLAFIYCPLALFASLTQPSEPQHLPRTNNMNLPWIQAVRIVQIIFGLIVLALTAYGALFLS